ncbi:MAG TPA: DUF4389 domain-containing protein [Acidimicrobiales bacterium]|nr:DUF4389 domain-containing protein [Acidimicrobiales bacterium]
MSGGKIALLVIGALAALCGLAMTAGGSVLVWAHATQRDSAGFYTAPTEHFATSTYALTSQLDLGGAPGEQDWTIAHPLGTLRVRATGGADPLFVGIAPKADVDRWLTGVSYERVIGANFGPLRTRSAVVSGQSPATSPEGQTFWVASASGRGTQTLLWRSEGGDWAVVVMNSDGRPGVSTDVAVGAKTGVLLPIGVGLGAFGLFLLAGAAAALFFALRHQVSSPVAVGATGPPAAPGVYPARLDGHLDPTSSRWLWLVKWVLVIPHFVALFFLWLALSVLTVVAGFAILFTGRYPRSIFDFNVGVMRWTWRVSFYALGAFGTDRYPPFSLRPEPGYPADFTVDYPEHLSRGLVLVKWWLLALPHYLVVAVFAGGWGFGWTGGWRIGGGGGLIALLVLVAAVVLAFSGRYPESIFDFVMGMNRWSYRVLAYVALMRDEYPPFRLDNGGLDPGSIPAGPPLPPPAPPAPPDRTGELVESST